MASCGSRGWLCFHVNVGSVRLPNGIYFSTGVPKGWPDLLILTDQGQAMFVETKIHPRKPTKLQLDMITKLKKQNFPAAVIYNLDEFKKFCEKHVKPCS